MIKKWTPVFLLLPFTVSAQLRMGGANSAILNITAKTYVVVTGNVVSSSDIAGSGNLVLNGDTLQALDLQGKQVQHLQVNNAANVNLLSNAVIANSLTFTAGKIFTNNQLLTMLPAATMQGYGIAQYISTSDAADNNATTGGVLITVPAGGSVLAPVGPNSKNYNPVTIQNTSGPSEKYTIRVSPAPIPGVSALQSLKITWNIAEATAGGNTIALKLQWRASNEGASFTRGSMKIVRSNGVSMVEKTGTIAATGNSTFLAAGGAFQGSSLFSATSDPNAFAMAIINPVRDESMMQADDIRMYPTILTGNNARLDIQAPADKKYLYVVTDMSGKTITKKDIGILKGGNSVTVSLPAIAKGMYILNVYDGSVLKKSIKFVKG